MLHAVSAIPAAAMLVSQGSGPLWWTIRAAHALATGVRWGYYLATGVGRMLASTPSEQHDVASAADRS